jgi:hypothetical protein
MGQPILALAAPRLSLILHQQGTALFSGSEWQTALCAMFLLLSPSCTMCTDMLLTVASVRAVLVRAAAPAQEQTYLPSAERTLYSLIT